MNKKAAGLLSEFVSLGNKFRIKLLGDSITHGAGGTGFVQDGPEIVPGWARNTKGYCWAKLFKDHMEEKFDCTVVNNACTGTAIQFIIDNFDVLVDNEDDIVICNIGTNDRHQHFYHGPRCTKQEYADRFYNNILVLHEKFKVAGKALIFIANIPASAEAEVEIGEDYWRHLHMDDINALYEKARAVCGFPLISFYTLFTDYCTQNNKSIDSLLADGLHPNDEGYRVMFELIKGELGV